MYRVIWYDNPNEKNGITIHEPANYGSKISSGILNLSVEGLGISTFEFSINLKNRAYRQIAPITHHFTVEDIHGVVVFKGRVAKITNEMSSNGEFRQKTMCEDKKAYLHDSTQKYMKPTVMSISSYLHKILAEHNSQVDAYKKIYLGSVTVKEDGDVYRGLAYGQTADVLREKLLDRLGGYLILRENNGLLYLDYLAEYGEDADTPLQIAKNLKSATREIDIEELATRIVPLGQDIDTDEEIEIGTDFSKPKVTISSVNDGKDYLQDDALVEEFGILQKEVYYSDVENPFTLKSNGLAYLRDQRLMLVTWTVDVVELGLLDERYGMITIGDSYLVSNPYLYENERLQVINKTIDILSPQVVNVTIGTGKQTLSKYQLSQKEIGKKIDSIASTVGKSQSDVALLKNQTNAIETNVSEQIETALEEQNQLLTTKLKEQEQVNASLHETLDDLNRKIEELAEKEKR